MTARITAAVCTYERYGCLSRCITSLRNQTLPLSAFEILIVDNSIDANDAEAALAVHSDAPNLRYLHHAPPGLSRARNRAFSECQAPLVAFIDDDAVAEPEWLENITEFFEQCAPDVGSLTGKVLPLWECPRPSWLDDRWLGYLTVTDWGDASILLGADKYPVGTNLTYRMTAVREAGAFNPEFGRCVDSLMSNEEFEYRRKLEAAGWTTHYAPDVTVRHAVTAERATPRWLCERLVWQSISNAALRGEDTATVRGLRRIADHIRGWCVSPDDLYSLWDLDDSPEDLLEACRRIELSQSNRKISTT